MSSSDDLLSTAADSTVAGPRGFMLRAGADDFAPGWSDTLPKLVIDLIDEAVIVTSLDLDPPGPKILYVNPGFTRLTGYSSAEVLGRNPRLLQGPATDRAMLDRVRRDLDASGEFEGEAVNYRKDGAEYVIEWRIKALRSERGEVTHWLSIQRDVTRRKRAEDEQGRLLRELDHRAKNALALVQGIVRLTKADDPVSYSQAVQARVGTVARAHSMLSDQQWNSLSLQRLLEAEVAPYARGRLTLNGPELLLSTQLVQPLALVAHELAGNAVRHGALSRPEGQIALRWGLDSEARTLRLQWEESFGPAPASQHEAGFGIAIIDAIICRQLRGSICRRWASNGLDCEITIPLP